jgi:hypothetical protein
VSFALEVLGGGLGWPSGHESDDSIEKERGEIRTRRRLLTSLLWLFVPVVGVFGYLTSESAAVLLAVVWAGFILVIRLFVVRSRCPRCGQRFHRVGTRALGGQSRVGWNPWTKSCGNCGLDL